MYKKLVCFDFDGTLFFTPEPHEGRKIWKEKTGFEFPYNGWWGKSETIDTDIFHIPVNEWVLNKYKESISDPDTYVILATGRLSKVQNMRNNVEKILDNHGIKFNEIHLNWGGDTFNFKTKLFEETMKKVKSSEFTMYDDRHEHLTKFKQWAIGQRSDINIIDVVNKRTTSIKNI